MLNHLIRADSEINYEDALQRALEQASTLASALHDAQIAVTDLSCSDDGVYHCEIEISLVAIGLEPDLDETAGQLLPAEPEDERDYRIALTKGRETLRRVIEDFLKDKTYVNLDRLPDFILTRIRPEDLLNKIVIHDFQDAVGPDAPEMIPAFTAALDAVPEIAPVEDDAQPEPE